MQTYAEAEASVPPPGSEQALSVLPKQTFLKFTSFAGWRTWFDRRPNLGNVRLSCYALALVMPAIVVQPHLSIEGWQ